MNYITNNSYFFDALKLSLNDKYKISDEGIMSLSDIVLRYGLGKVAQEGYLIPLIYLLDKNSMSFPCTYSLLKKKWEKDNLVLSFNTVLKMFIDEGLILIRKLTETLFNTSIVIRDSDEQPDEMGLYIVIYGSNKYKEFMKEISESGLLSERVNLYEQRGIYEGYGLSKPSKKYEDLITRLKGDLTLRGCKFNFEAFTEDIITQEEEFNFTVDIGNLSNELRDSDITRILKKNVKGTNLIELKTYADDEDTVFIGLKLKSSIDKYELVKMETGILLSIEEIQHS